GVVEDDGEPLADVRTGQIPELPRPLLIESNGDIGTTRAEPTLLHGDAGVGELVSCHLDLRLEEVAPVGDGARQPRRHPFLDLPDEELGALRRLAGEEFLERLAILRL